MPKLLKSIWWLVVVLIFHSGCGMVGVYQGPEPFGGNRYNVSPPKLRLNRNVKIVLLVLEDKRPRMSKDLDWARQSHVFRNSTGQPSEVRNEFYRAIKSGLNAHPQIKVISPKQFLKSKKADLVISGKIHRCEADRSMGMWSQDAVAESVIEIVLRDGRGKKLTKKPLHYAKEAKRVIRSDSNHHIYVGIIGGTVEDSIEKVVTAFISGRDLTSALERVSR